MKILLTGATGFIGKALVSELIKQDFDLSIAVRQKTNLFPNKVKQYVVGDFESNPDFSNILTKIDCVIHLAGRAHVIDKTKASILNEFRKLNTEFTLNLAKQAATAGVKRFIFLSSIRVNGNQNTKPFLEIDTPNPQEPYAISKHEAEQGLLKLAENSSLKVVIIRSPLVYGKDAPGNFGRLVQWASAKIMLPLPLGAINNSRSLIAIDNLVSFIILCVLHEKSVNEIFLISDNDTYSTTELLNKIAKAFNKQALLFTVPVNWMIFVAKLLGKEADAVRLFSSLIIDSSKARDLLGWHSITTIDKQLNKIIKNEKTI
jgi:nucleoside-diphosphate-sugar epimerase